VVNDIGLLFFNDLLYVIDCCIEVLLCSVELPGCLVCTGRIIKDNDDEVAVDTPTAICSELKHCFSLRQELDTRLGLLIPDKLSTLTIETCDLVQVGF
jgi:hypothetical protein